MANVDHLKISRFGGAATFVTEDPKTGFELTLNLQFSKETILEAPQPGGPHEGDPRVFVVLTAQDLEAGFPELVAVGDTASGVELSSVNRGLSSSPIRVATTVPVPMVDEFGVGFFATLDFTFQVSGPVIHEVLHEKATLPDGGKINTHIQSEHAAAKATGTLTFEAHSLGGTYHLSTSDAELFWEKAHTMTVFPHGEPEALALVGAAGSDWIL